MSLIEDAIALERNAETTYRSAAAHTGDASARQILELLADEECRHAETLAAWDRGSQPEEVEVSLRAEVRGAIEGAGPREGTLFEDSTMRDVLQRAMEVERATQHFYEERAAAAEGGLQALFGRLAEREREHYLLVSSLSEYFDRPVEWVESAEFGLRPEY